MRKNLYFARHVFYGLLGATLTSSCAIWPQEGEPLPSGGFRSTAAIRSQTLPLPVEIASDISRITEEGEIEREKQDKLQRTKLEQKLKERADKENSEKFNTEEKHPISGRKRFVRQPARTGPQEKYTVKPGDTLMKIAFSKYGSVYRWREIYQANQEILGHYNKIPVGVTIVIYGVEFEVIEKNGEPYLIKKGDTLRRISNRLYGTPDRWRDLWQNNRRLIRHPDRIYAGFVMYYRPLSEVSTSRAPTSR